MQPPALSFPFIRIDGPTVIEFHRAKRRFDSNAPSHPRLETFLGKLPHVVPNIPHIDLRHVCAKLGLHGGLKQIEKTLGIKRPDDLEGVSGEDAVYLWQQYKATGKRDYLETLVRYNEEDIVNLMPIADGMTKRLWEQTRHGTKN